MFHHDIYLNLRSPRETMDTFWSWYLPLQKVMVFNQTFVPRAGSQGCILVIVLTPTGASEICSVVVFNQTCVPHGGEGIYFGHGIYPQR